MLPESEEERRALWALMKDVQENAQPSVVTPGKWLESWPSGTFSCLDCGGKVSWKSEKCVHCGNSKARDDLEYKLRQEFGDFTRGVKGVALVRDALSKPPPAAGLHPAVAGMSPAELWSRVGLSGEVNDLRYRSIAKGLSKQLENGQSLDEALESMKKQLKLLDQIFIIILGGALVLIVLGILGKLVQ